MKAAIITAIIAIVSVGHVSAQTMYRCGNTFSQQPCGADAKSIPTVGVVQPGPGVDPDKVAAIKVACQGWVRDKPSWKDRDSVKSSTPVRGKRETRTVDGVGQIVVAYRTSVNAKNSYGAYQGEKTYVCYANQDETKVIDLQAPVE